MHLLVLTGARFFLHIHGFFQCLTVHGETQCACGHYTLSWEDEEA